MTGTLFMILALLLTKHLLGDFVLQNKYMLRKTDPENWIKPLLTHSAVHAVLTFVTMAFFTNLQMLLLVTVLDFAAHTCIDAWKARLAQYPISDQRFWWSFGFDQWLHGITYLQIAFLVS